MRELVLKSLKAPYRHKEVTVEATPAHVLHDKYTNNAGARTNHWLRRLVDGDVQGGHA